MDLQKGLYTIEEILHYNDGSLSQFVVDDKGAVAVCVIGYPHISHDNDAVRAVSFGLEIKERLKELSIDFAIGIASGNAFCGTIGSKTRHEYSIVGDIGKRKFNLFYSKTEINFIKKVNLSARLMSASIKSAEKLYVETSTYLGANKSIQFKELGKIQVKGKANPITIYFPSFRSHDKFVSTPQVKIGRFKLRGRENELLIVHSLIDDITKFTIPQIILFEGVAGIGKSALLRGIVDVII